MDAGTRRRAVGANALTAITGVLGVLLLHTAGRAIGQRRAVRPRVIVLGLISLLTIGAAPALWAAGPASAACAPVTIVMMAGTGETNSAANPNVPVGMLKGVTDKVQTAVGDKVQVLFPAYSASAFNKGLDYVQSKQTGKDSLKHTLASLCSTTQVVLGGYSQGADVAGDIASDIGNDRGPIPASRVLAVALLADPGRGTSGESLVGPDANSGVGVGGDRPGGMGSLAGRVATICDTGNNTSPGDMYCNLDRQKYPLVASISQMLAMTPTEAKAKVGEDNTTTASTTTTPSTTTGTTSANQISGLPGTTGQSPTGSTTASQLTSAMTQDWSSADLPNLGANITQLTNLVKGANDGTINAGQVATVATSVANSLKPLLTLTSTGTTDKTTLTNLAQSPQGSDDNAASRVLTAANKTDLSGAVTSASNLASTATNLAQQSGSTNDTDVPLNSTQGQQLATTASQLGQQTTSLTSTPSDVMSAATNVLSVLSVQKVISQALNVFVGLGSTNWLGIINAINQAVQRAVALDVPGVRTAAQDLNVAIGPLVKMAAQVDFKWIAKIVALIPDPYGYAQIAATVLSYLGNLDIIRLVNDIERIEGVAFDVLEQKNLLRTADLIPVGLDLAGVAAGVLTGGTKTDPSGYQPNLTTNTTLSSQVSNADFLGLTNSMSQLASTENVNNIASLVDAGVEVSQFVGGATRNHVGYGNYKVDNSGRSAIQWLADWITLKVQRANAA